MSEHQYEWYDQNLRALTIEVAQIRQRLLAYCETDQISDQPLNAEQMEIDSNNDAVVAQDDSFVSALDSLCERFSLTPFARQLILLCVGMELDESCAFLCAKANGDALKAYPTLGLALRLFEEVDRTVLAPESNLRRWQLIEINNNFNVLNSPLKVNERILFYLYGDNSLDRHLFAWLKPVHDNVYAIESHCKLAQQINQYWLHGMSGGVQVLPVLSGNDMSSQQNIALIASHYREAVLLQLEIKGFPATGAEFAELGQLMLRESILNNVLYFIVYDDLSEHLQLHTVMQLANLLRGFCILATLEPLNYRNIPICNIETKKPLPVEQKLLWETMLDATDLYPVTELIAHYNFGIAEIKTACSTLAVEQSAYEQSLSSPAVLWQICRHHSRRQLEGLAQRVDCKASWNDIVLPEPQLRMLHEIILQIKQRHKVYNEWGFANKSARGFGINALFSGPSGTGKTLAAEVIARELAVDLYQIDLSAIVSKYIGETEKNLQKIFEVAESSGAILLFDEADSLFGKRSEVKDSHDRYANMEVSYLLQRMEAYRGLSILTTNLRSALDQAFLRRLRFIVNFPFPESAQRTLIWQRIFPAQVPVQEIDFEKLGQLNVTGGNIRSIALNAAFIAADANEPVQMQHLLQAVHTEYLKLGKAPNTSEISGWL